MSILAGQKFELSSGFYQNSAKEDSIEVLVLDENKIDLKSINIEHGKLAGRGGAFLVNPLDRGFVFSREQFSEEHKMFEQTAKDFGIKNKAGRNIVPFNRA